VDIRQDRVTPITVTIFHKTGVATIPLWKLPPDLQKQFGYDPQKAAQWQTAQQKSAAEVVGAKRKAAAAEVWDLTVEQVLPNGFVAGGYEATGVFVMVTFSYFRRSQSEAHSAFCEAEASPFSGDSAAKVPTNLASSVASATGRRMS
jgi:hypothetical protein